MAGLAVRVARRLTAEIAGSMGYELTPRRSSALSRLRAAGVQVETVLDVGAALGDWTLECAKVFPEATYILIEPLEEFSGALSRVTTSLPQAEHVQAAAAATDGKVTLNIHADLVGSSLFTESEGGSIDGVPRVVPSRSLDSLVHERGAAAPYLVKVDVQGAESDVLRGAGTVIAESAAVILEVSFVEFFEGGLLAHELIQMMSERELVVYDVVDLLDRPLDGTLAQANVVFVPRLSAARREKGFASAQQRAELNQRINAAVRSRLDG